MSVSFKPECIQRWCVAPPGVPYGPTVINDCHCCAERKMLKTLEMKCIRQGVHFSKIPHWIHRKYGDFVIERVLYGGEYGTSIPCVICRKALERFCVQWRAHIGDMWFKSTDPEVPRSSSNTKTKIKVKFRG
jgi:hypothetical protein